MPAHSPPNATGHTAATAAPQAAALCARCSRMGNSCCVADRKEADLFFPLSQKEWERLQPYAHLALLDDATLERQKPEEDSIRQSVANSPEFLASMGRMFPAHVHRFEVLFPTPGKHFHIAVRHNGECAFLGEEGCVLPREVRPWYCLLFPIWVHGNTLTNFVPKHCLVTQTGQYSMSICRLLGNTPEEVRRLFACLCEDWGLTAKKR